MGGGGRLDRPGLDELRPQAVKLTAPQEVIAAALRNLVEKPIRVSKPGGAIAVFVGPGNQLHMRDAGPGVPRRNAEPLAPAARPRRQRQRWRRGPWIVDCLKVMASHAGELVTNPVDRELILAFPSGIANKR